MVVVVVVVCRGYYRLKSLISSEYWFLVRRPLLLHYCSSLKNEKVKSSVLPWSSLISIDLTGKIWLVCWWSVISLVYGIRPSQVINYRMSGFFLSLTEITPKHTSTLFLLSSRTIIFLLCARVSLFPLSFLSFSLSWLSLIFRQSTTRTNEKKRLCEIIVSQSANRRQLLSFSSSDFFS